MLIHVHHNILYGFFLIINKTLTVLHCRKCRESRSYMTPSTVSLTKVAILRSLTLCIHMYLMLPLVYSWFINFILKNESMRLVLFPFKCSATFFSAAMYCPWFATTRCLSTLHCICLLHRLVCHDKGVHVSYLVTCTNYWGT